MAEHGVVSVTWRDAAREMSAGLHELVDGLPEWAQDHPRLDEALSAYEGHMVTTTTRAHVLAMLKGMDNAPPSHFSIGLIFDRGGWDEMMLPRPYLYSDGDYTNRHYWIGVRLATKGGEGLIEMGVRLCVPPRLFPIDDAVRRLHRRLRRQP